MESARDRIWERRLVTIGILATFALLRLYATVGAPIETYPDSASYFEFRFWGAVRQPAITGLYASIGDARAITVVQAAVGVACWSVAAVVLGSTIAHAPRRRILQVTVLVLGLTQPVTAWDSVLLSESLSISVSVLVVSLLAKVVNEGTTTQVVVALAAGATWAFTRPIHAVILVVVAAGLAAIALGAPGARRPRLGVAIGLLVVAASAMVVASSNAAVPRNNTAQVLARRIIPDEGHARWFHARGMPEVVGAGAWSPTTDTAVVFGRVHLLRSDDDFRSWLTDEGPSTYLRFVLLHPAYVVRPLLEDEALVGGLLSGARYAHPRPVVPGFVEAVYWPRTATQGAIAGVIWLGFVAAAGATAARARRLPSAAPLATVMIVATGFGVLVVAHTAGAEYARLLVGSGVMARIALLWLGVEGSR